MARAIAEVGARSIKQLAIAKWRSSGLTEQHARQLRFKALNANEVLKLSTRFHHAGALHIPYFDLDGKPTKFFRLRYLERLPGAAGVVEKPQRYDQLAVLQEAYYPPLLDWRDLATDPEKSVAITEGELKAACACAHGIPMLALGGVYSFMSSKRSIDLLPSLKEFNWRERRVYIVYDNDVMHKPEVMRAQHVLAQRLLAEGAKISYVSIPIGPEKGVDDYIVKFGSAAFSELIHNALPYLEAEALWALNEDVVLVRNNGLPLVIERSSNMAMNPDVFQRVLYANRHFMQEIEKGQGKNKHIVQEKAKLAPHWMEWEHRAELGSVSYEPGQPQICGDAWNMWTGWGVKPKKGSVKEWHWLMEFIFGRDDKARRYFEQWCAYPIQNPGAKLYSAAVIWSRVKRLGKSMAGIALSKIYGENAQFINSKQLKGSFNTWANNKQLIIGEEITAGEARVDADYMKDLITNPTFTINTKFKAEYTIPNHTNFLFLSNHPDAIFLEDGDQRYFIHGIQRESPGPREKYEWCDAWLHGDGPAFLMQYLLDLNLRGFNPREHAPSTLSKMQMTLAGKNDMGLWVVRLQEDPAQALRALGQEKAEKCDLFTPEQLYHAFDPEGRYRGRGAGNAAMGLKLVAAGFHQLNGGVPIRCASGLHRLYAVRNLMKWDQATRAEIKEHYDSFYNTQTVGAVK